MRLTAGSLDTVIGSMPMIMGIVNLSKDSFSGDGCAGVSAAVDKAMALVEDGAHIIDVGAESARSNRQAISELEEADRLCEFCRAWRDRTPSPLLSINTWRPAVARAVLREGGDLLNDIGGLVTDESARICAKFAAGLVIMHTVGEPKVPHTHVRYLDVMESIERFFEEKIGLAEAAGLSHEAIVLDPGIDFAKQRDDNLTIYREFARLRRFQRPILLPVSRKTVIGDILGVPPAERDAGTVACSVAGILRGANILRVHHVRATVQAVRVLEAVEAAQGSAG